MSEANYVVAEQFIDRDKGSVFEIFTVAELEKAPESWLLASATNITIEEAHAIKAELEAEQAEILKSRVR